MIVKLEQNTKHAICEILYEFQKQALHESIMIVLHFYGTNSVFVNT